MRRDRMEGRGHEALQTWEAVGTVGGDIVAGVGDRHEAVGLGVEHASRTAFSTGEPGRL